MDKPPQVVLKHVGPDGTLERDVLDRIARLERFYERIVSCRVSVEGPGPHHRQGAHRVRIELRVPGSRLTITRRSGERAEHALRAAFDAATRRIGDYVRRVRGQIKQHA